MVLIQIQWKSILTIHKIRKRLLIKYWDNACNDLISKYEKMGKKHKSLVIKLKCIDSKKRNEEIECYYKNAKRNHHLDFKKWLRSNMNKRKSLKEQTNINVTKKSDKYIAVVRKAPIFYYKQPIEKLNNMILSVIK